MTYSLHPEAESEFHEAIEYYESCEADAPHTLGGLATQVRSLCRGTL
jgi:hypothetical protein